MNKETGTWLVAAEGAEIAAYFSTPEKIDEILSRIESEALSYAPDTSTAKGRKAIASLAAKVARSKTALDGAGKSLNDDRRAAINAVDAERRKIRERLDALKDRVRKPLTQWEEAEAARVARHKSALDELNDTGRVDGLSDSGVISVVIEEVEAIAVGPDWEEFQDEAIAAKGRALEKFRADLAVATAREAEQEELARLRAAEEERKAKEAAESAERERKEAEERAQRDAAEAQKMRAEKASAYIGELADGKIAGETQPYGILIYELEKKLPPLIDDLGEFAPPLHVKRLEALATIKADAEAARIREEERAKAAAEAEAKAAAERAAQAERDRIADEVRANEQERAKREADRRHLDKIRSEIISALSSMRGKATPENIADALMSGKIPHTKVNV